MIKAGEFPPFLAGPGYQQPQLFTSARTWVQGDTALTVAEADALVARLKSEGFVALLNEPLGSPTAGQDAASWVMQLGSAAAARAELAANVRDAASTSNPPVSTFTPFSVSAIPGARGYHLGGTGGQAIGDNIAFADGPFLYAIGDGWETTLKSPPPRSALIEAATRLYKRVHGHPAG